MKKIVITGATGMIGVNIVRLALKRGDKVLCVIRSGSEKEKRLPVHKNLKIIYSDISKYNVLNTDDSYDYFIHLAWDKTFGYSRDDVESQLQNVKYTLDAVHLAKRLGCKVFVGAGSQAEYGPVTEKLKAETPVNPLSGYGIAKYSAGKLSGLLCSQLGIRQNWVRVLSVYGSLDNTNTLISYVADCIQNNIAPELTRCEQIWDYLNETDAASAFLAIADKGVNSRVYVLGSGIEMQLSDYIKIMYMFDKNGIVPEFGKKDYFPNQPMYLCADISSITQDTGWRPSVKFIDGISCIFKKVLP